MRLPPRLAPLIARPVVLALSLAALAAPAGIVSGCGPSAAPVDMARDFSVLVPIEIGTTAVAYDDTSAFAALTPGQKVMLQQGSQGGFHVPLKFRVSLPPAVYGLSKRASRVSDGAAILRQTVDVTIDATDGGPWELQPATRMFQCPVPIGVNIIDTPVLYVIELLDTFNRPIAHGEVPLVPDCPTSPADALAFCISICNGK